MFEQFKSSTIQAKFEADIVEVKAIIEAQRGENSKIVSELRADHNTTVTDLKQYVADLKQEITELRLELVSMKTQIDSEATYVRRAVDWLEVSKRQAPGVRGSAPVAPQA